MVCLSWNGNVVKLNKYNFIILIGDPENVLHINWSLIATTENSNNIAVKNDICVRRVVRVLSATS